jgi:cleavage stimulation factor subunit 2
MVKTCPQVTVATISYTPCFLEPSDHETAASAVRNLNGTDVKGRPLRIDLADSDPLLEGKTTNRGELEGGIIGASHSGSHASTFAKQTIPRGVQVPPGSTALDVISNVIASMQPAQMMDIMGHMKVCSRSVRLLMLRFDLR